MLDYLKKPPLLQVKNLTTSFYMEGGLRPVIKNVDFDLRPGETLGIIGESGCGKTVTSLSIMRLIPKGVGEIQGGEVFLEGTEILGQPIEKFRKIRGKQISMIFQDPMTSLNPVLKIGKQVAEVLLVHENLNPKKARARVAELLSEVGIPDPEKQLDSYPHQLSGGMKQRVMIAMALACNPKVLIADEPTTALDVTIQAQILQLLERLKQQHQMSMLMITHDLGVVAQSCDYVLVMYAGRVVEKGFVKELFSGPLHPYTNGLMRSILSIMESEGEKLFVIDGMVPAVEDDLVGCSFANRCPKRQPRCDTERPELLLHKNQQAAACHFPENLEQEVVK